MRTLLLLALASSLGLNLFLLRAAGRPEAAGRRPSVPAPGPAPAPMVSGESEDAQPAADAGTLARIGELGRAESAIFDLEHAIADVREQLAPWEGVPAAVLAAQGQGSLHEKLLALAALPSDEQEAAVRQLTGPPATEGPAITKEQILAAIREESDPAALGPLRMLVKLGALGPMTADDLRPLLPLLRLAELPERRAILARVVGEWRAPVLPPEWVVAVAGCLRAEPDPRVVNELASALSWEPRAELLPAMRAAVERLPPGEERDEVLYSFGKVSVELEQGRALYALWTAEQDPDSRVRIVRLLAMQGAAHSPVPAPAGSGTTLRAELREGFLALYRSDSAAEQRALLAVAATRGLGLAPEGAPDTIAFLLEVATAEPDAAQKGRLRRLAQRVQEGLPPACDEAARILTTGE